MVEPPLHRGRRACSRKPGIVRTLFDPACGTGGMLSVAEDYLRELNPDARLEVFGQELNAETYAICRSDMMIKGQDASNIRLRQQLHRGRPSRAQRFDYLLANPPFGVEWKKVQRDDRGRAREARLRRPLRRRACRASTTARFLFLQHMISQDEAPRGGRRPARHRLQRLAAVHRRAPARARARSAAGSSRTTGSKPSSPCPTSSSTTPASAPTSGSSPTARRPERRGKVQLVDARELFTKMRKSLGDKRKEISRRPDRRDHPPLRRLRARATACKIFANEDFGFQRITVERPLRLRWEVTDDGIDALRQPTRSSPSSTTTPRGAARATWATTSDSSDDDAEIRRPREARRCCGPGSRARRSRSHRRRLRRPRPRRPDRHRPQGQPEPDPDLRDNENVPLPSVPSAASATNPTPPSASARGPTATRSMRYLAAEVLPYVPDAWVDHDQDQDRLRDPPHPPLLQLHPTPTPRRDRRRDQGARRRDPGAAARGDGVSRRPRRCRLRAIVARLGTADTPPFIDEYSAGWSSIPAFDRRRRTSCQLRDVTLDRRSASSRQRSALGRATYS